MYVIEHVRKPACGGDWRKKILKREVFCIYELNTPFYTIILMVVLQLLFKTPVSISYGHFTFGALVLSPYPSLFQHVICSCKHNHLIGLTGFIPILELQPIH